MYIIDDHTSITGMSYPTFDYNTLVIYYYMLMHILLNHI